MTAEDREKLKLQVMRHEGIRLKPYQDTVGKWTIGVGRNLSDRGITNDEAEFLLENDLHECISDCRNFPWFDALDGVRQRVICDMRFNLGASGLRRFRNTLAAISRADYNAAADGMVRSLWARQVKGRATALAAMMRTGQDFYLS